MKWDDSSYKSAVTSLSLLRIILLLFLVLANCCCFFLFRSYRSPNYQNDHYISLFKLASIYHTYPCSHAFHNFLESCRPTNYDHCHLKYQFKLVSIFPLCISLYSLSAKICRYIFTLYFLVYFKTNWQVYYFLLCISLYSF